MPRPRTRAPRAAAAVALVLAAALSGCSQGAGTADTARGGGKVTLRFTWWGNADRAERTEEVVAAFERAHPDIDIRTSYASYESYKQKLATQAAGGDAPDLVQLDYRQISQYAGSGVLLDLATRRADLPTGDMDAGLLRTGQLDGTQYALPMGVGTQAMAYDRRAWRAAGLRTPEPGWTWADWEAALRTLERETGRAAMTDPGAMEDWFEVWLRGRGGRLYDADGRAAFTAADLAGFWSYTTRLRKAGLVSPARATTQLDGSVENSPMGREQVVAEFNWDAPSAGYEAVHGDRLALAPMPAGPGPAGGAAERTGGGADGDGDKDGKGSGTGARLGQYLKPTMLIGIAAGTEHPGPAARFLDFLLNGDEAADILGVDRGLPVNRKQRERVLPRLTGFQRQVARLQESVAGRLKDPPSAPPRGDNALQSVFQRDYDHVAFDKATPRRAAEDYLTEARAELNP